MIHDLLLRWMVTGLFAVSAVESARLAIRERRPWTTVLTHGLHFAMAVAMAVMAWPWMGRFPQAGPVAFFSLATVWFVALAIFAARTTTLRELYGYHGFMMLACAWMFASTNRAMSASMPGMALAMTAMDMPAGGGPPAWFSAVNWLGTFSFAAAAVFWTARYVREHRHGIAGLRPVHDLKQAMMATGMAIEFLAMVFPI
ncbi:DUF5134 domain-containing protein [Mycobacterium sp. SM1]|uniref:DUF5134 domain-containing protein n=1 Tax=Mycobacterium sp. SM1 TaxID=2816243 RepID=UPI001BCF5488|nr:DUF5134 domain-containing protein [Mycobacterium sp. SM1]MBS4728825.1 DUF5134 domain-containing protein [Mycobacterium sp. SM1]